MLYHLHFFKILGKYDILGKYNISKTDNLFSNAHFLGFGSDNHKLYANLASTLEAKLDYYLSLTKASSLVKCK